jgi:GntR family transcriptional regulator/MocR family aminotransferase
MARIWSTSQVDLHLEFAGSRVRRGLEEALREGIRAGRLSPGSRLPSSRALARDLGIARNTVVDAYGQLVDEGWLSARPGSGTSIAQRPAAPDTTLASGRPAIASVRYDLRPGAPNLSWFPRSAWLGATRRALTAATPRSLGYGDPRGQPELRHAIAEYLGRARGVRVAPDQVVICAGFAHGLALLCRMLRTRGATTLAAEAYGLGIHRSIAEAQELRLTTVPVDDRGAVLDGLGTAGALVLTPAHQFPLGPALAAERRFQAVEWAAVTGGLIVEDDYDGEFRYDRQPLGALQALAPESVVYAGTASKTLAPGLRLGWLVVPSRFMDDLLAAKSDAGHSAGTIDQLTLADLIASGGYERHVRRCRRAYRQRRDRFVARLEREVPQVRVTGIAAGLHALVELSDGQSETDVVERARQHGLAVQGLGSFSLAEHDHRPALVVGYGTPPDHAFSTATARLCAALAG